MVVACAALFVSLGGVGYAAIVLPANSVGTKQLKRNAVNSAKVKKHSLLRSDFKRGQVPRGPQGPQGIQGAQGIQQPGIHQALELAACQKVQRPSGVGWRRLREVFLQRCQLFADPRCRIQPDFERKLQGDVQPVDRELCRHGELPACI